MDEKTVEAVKSGIQEIAKYVENTAPALINEVAKVSAVESGVTTIVCLLFALLLGRVTVNAWRRGIVNDDGDMTGGAILCGIVGGCFVIAGTINLISCLQWLVSPTGKFIMLMMTRASS